MNSNNPNNANNSNRGNPMNNPNNSSNSGTPSSAADTMNYLKSETLRLRKKTRMFKALGIVLTLIVLVYAGLGYWYSEVLTKPENLANFVVVRFSEQAPKVIAATEMKLMQDAPGTAEKLSKALQEAIPQVRMRAQESFTALVKHKFAEAETATLKIADSYFAAHADAFAPRVTGESVEAYANRVANVLADNFGNSVSETLKVSTGKDLHDFNTRTKEILTSLQSHTGLLAKEDYAKLTRSQQLESIVIAYVVNNYMTMKE